MDFIRKSLTKKITFGILLGVLMVFAVALGFLFVKSRQMVKKEAYERAERLLANTNHRVEAYLNEAEVATHNIYWIVLHHMQPDSLLASDATSLPIPCARVTALSLLVTPNTTFTTMNGTGRLKTKARPFG